VRHPLPEARGRPPVSAPALVAGIGSSLRGDDAAGLEVARGVRSAGARVRVVELEGEPIDLLEAVGDAPELVLVDAVVAGAPAGTVHRRDLSGSAARLPVAGVLAHTFGLADTVELARVLGRLPPRVELYAIEGSCFAIGAPMGAAVQAAVVAVACELGERFGALPARP
jgi:hydrogenase maturation protease